MSRHSIDINNLKGLIKGFSSLKVLVIGDLIIDEYITCEALGMSHNIKYFELNSGKDFSLIDEIMNDRLRKHINLNSSSNVLLFNTEGATDINDFNKISNDSNIYYIQEFLETVCLKFQQP